MEATHLLVGHPRFLTVDVSPRKGHTWGVGSAPTSWDPEDDPAAPVTPFFPPVVLLCSGPASQTVTHSLSPLPAHRHRSLSLFLCDFCTSCHKTLKFCLGNSLPVRSWASGGGSFEDFDWDCRSCEAEQVIWVFPGSIRRRTHPHATSHPGGPRSSHPAPQPRPLATPLIHPQRNIRLHRASWELKGLLGLMGVPRIKQVAFSECWNKGEGL